jgi:hypothetical protein
MFKNQCLLELGFDRARQAWPARVSTKHLETQSWHHGAGVHLGTKALQRQAGSIVRTNRVLHMQSNGLKLSTATRATCGPRCALRIEAMGPKGPKPKAKMLVGPGPLELVLEKQAISKRQACQRTVPDTSAPMRQCVLRSLNRQRVSRREAENPKVEELREGEEPTVVLPKAERTCNDLGWLRRCFQHGRKPTRMFVRSSWRYSDRVPSLGGCRGAARPEGQNQEQGESQGAGQVRQERREGHSQGTCTSSELVNLSSLPHGRHRVVCFMMLLAKATAAIQSLVPFCRRTGEPEPKEAGSDRGRRRRRRAVGAAEKEAGQVV